MTTAALALTPLVRAGLVATTGIGFRGWVEAAEGWGLAEELLAENVDELHLAVGETLPDGRQRVVQAQLVDGRFGGRRRLGEPGHERVLLPVHRRGQDVRGVAAADPVARPPAAWCR